MALPTLSKTWQFNVNQTITGATQQASDDATWLALASSLTGFATNPWTVVSSSEWGPLVHNFAGSTHSWIVLENPVTGVQLCLDCNHSTQYYGTVAVSFGGLFTGGSATARPTATDQILLKDTTGLWVSGAFTAKLHAMHSTDGECSRLFMCHNNGTTIVLLFERAASPVGGWSGDLVISGFSSAPLTYAAYNDVSTNTFSRLGGVTAGLYLSSEGFIGSMIGEHFTFDDDDTGEWPMCPMGVVSFAGANRGRKGALCDLWWGSTAVAMGATYPDDASKQFVQIGHMIFPWNGSTPETA